MAFHSRKTTKLLANMTTTEIGDLLVKSGGFSEEISKCFEGNQILGAR